MVDTMAVLGAAASAKLAGDRLVRDVVTYIRETRLAAKTPDPKPTRRRRHRARLSRPMKSSTSGLGRRPSSSRLSKKVSLMTDAELEAELEIRRRRRAKEREMYSRAMRSDKLTALESELANLRREIGRIEPGTARAPGKPGTPHSVRWEPLPRGRRSLESRTPFAPGQQHAQASPGVSLSAPPARGPPGPPPPPPPPPPPGGDDDDGLTVNPEKQKREKAERQRRREAKKKEREQAQKKLTLADIIRSAGPDPMKRLKPATQKAADAEKEEFERAKREREEREMRQEQERIEQEKKALEDMGRRITEKSAEHVANGSETETDGNNSSVSEDRDSRTAEKPVTEMEAEKATGGDKDSGAKKAGKDKGSPRKDAIKSDRSNESEKSDSQTSSGNVKEVSKTRGDAKSELDSKEMPLEATKSDTKKLSDQKQSSTEGKKRGPKESGKVSEASVSPRDNSTEKGVLNPIDKLEDTEIENIAPNTPAKDANGVKSPAKSPLESNKETLKLEEAP